MRGACYWFALFCVCAPCGGRACLHSKSMPYFIVQLHLSFCSLSPPTLYMILLARSFLLSLADAAAMHCAAALHLPVNSIALKICIYMHTGIASRQFGRKEFCQRDSQSYSMRPNPPGSQAECLGVHTAHKQ